MPNKNTKNSLLNWTNPYSNNIFGNNNIFDKYSINYPSNNLYSRSLTSNKGSLNQLDKLNTISRGMDLNSEMIGLNTDLSEVGLPDKINFTAKSRLHGGLNTLTNAQKTMGTVGSISSLAGGIGKATGLIKDVDHSAETETLNQVYDELSNVAGPVVGGIMKTAGFVTDVAQGLGMKTDQMTWSDKLLDSKFSAITPLGITNSVFGRRAHRFNRDDETNEKIGSSYTGSLDTFDKADKKSNKKYGLLSRGSRKRANRQIKEANRQQEVMSTIKDDAEVSFASSSNPYIALGNQFNQRGGWSHNGIRVGKTGMKVNLNRARNLLKNAYIDTDKKVMLKKGGKFNVIPEGNLHAHLNHISKHNKDLEVTRKGIPIVSIEKGGEVVQHAEVEKEEIIFRLEVTKELERLKEIGTDEAAIEAGKLLVEEILNNTQDRAELMDKIEL